MTPKAMKAATDQKLMERKKQLLDQYELFEPEIRRMQDKLDLARAEILRINRELEARNKKQ